MRRIVLIFFILAMPLSLLAEGAFVRITRAEDLTENGEYIILTANSTRYPGVYIMSNKYMSSGFYRATSISGDDNLPEKIEDASAAMIWRVAYGGDRIFLRSAEGVLEARGNTLQPGSTTPTLWEVQVEGGRFFLMNSGKYLMASLYDDINTKSRFGFYEKPSDTVKNPCHLYIYKRSEVPESMSDYVRYFPVAAQWETICLPFDADVPASCDAFEITGREADDIKHSESASQLHAGVPYLIIRARVGIEKFEKRGGSVKKPADGYLRGTFQPLRISRGYVLDANNFVSATGNTLVPAFRAYIP